MQETGLYIYIYSLSHNKKNTKRMRNPLKIKLNKSLFILSLLVVGATFFACNPDEETTPTARTVDRSQLTDKQWYRDGEKWFYFDSDGTMDPEGTCEWYATGDSLKVNSSLLGVYDLHFDYIAENEAKFGEKPLSSRVVYTTTP